MSGAITLVDPADDADVLFRGDSLDQSVDLAESVLRKTLDAIHESWPQ